MAAWNLLVVSVPEAAPAPAAVSFCMVSAIVPIICFCEGIEDHSSKAAAHGKHEGGEQHSCGLSQQVDATRDVGRVLSWECSRQDRGGNMLIWGLSPRKLQG